MNLFKQVVDGRRGKDKVGYVIHLCSLYNPHDMNSFRLLLEGQPQKLQGKFDFSYRYSFQSKYTIF